MHCLQQPAPRNPSPGQDRRGRRFLRGLKLREFKGSKSERGQKRSCAEGAIQACEVAFPGGRSVSCLSPLPIFWKAARPAGQISVFGVGCATADATPTRFFCPPPPSPDRFRGRNLSQARWPYLRQYQNFPVICLLTTYPDYQPTSVGAPVPCSGQGSARNDRGGWGGWTEG